MSRGTPKKTKEEDTLLDSTLRPKRWEEYIGQEKVKKSIKIIIEAAKKRGEPCCEHLLFYGASGLGKTTLSYLVAKELGTNMRVTSGPAIEKAGDLAALLTNLTEGEVLFIDECLDGDTLISLTDGTFKKIKDIKNGDEVIGGKVSNFFSKKIRQIIRVTTSFTTLECSENHPWIIVRKGRIKTVPAKALKTSDYTISPLSLPHMVKNNITPGQARFLAMILCDGHIDKNLLTIQVEVKKDKKYFKKIFEEGLYNFGVTTQSLNQEGRKRKLKTVFSCLETKRGTQMLRIYSKKLANDLLSLGIPCGNKHDIIKIPEILFTAPLKTVAAFINTCFCCEGWPISSKNGEDNRLILDMNSKIFVQQLQLLLKKFGIHSNFMIRKRKKEIYRLTIRGYDLILFKKKIGLRLSRKSKILSQICKRRRFLSDLIPLPKFTVNNQFDFTRMSRQNLERILALNPNLDTRLKYRYEKIRKIEKIRKEKIVYDFTTTEHIFIANGILTHNCHRINKTLEEYLYPAMEDYKLNLILGKGPMARSMTLELPPFTLIGATTRIALISPPLRNRFGAKFQLNYYQLSDIEKIIERSAKILRIDIDREAITAIAERSRFTPRVANRLLKRVRDFVQVEGDGVISKENAIKAFNFLEIDEKGLEVGDRRILESLIKKFNGGPVGIQSLAAASSEEEETILNIYEPYLMQIGFIKRTPRGRIATELAYKHLRLKHSGPQNSLI